MKQIAKVIKLRLKGGSHSVIGKGVITNLKIEVLDEVAYFQFPDSHITKRFAYSQNEVGTESVYLEKTRKCACAYPGMKQEEIIKHIFRRLKELSTKRENGFTATKPK